MTMTVNQASELSYSSVSIENSARTAPLQILSWKGQEENVNDITNLTVTWIACVY